MDIDKMAGSLAEHFVDGKYKKAGSLWRAPNISLADVTEEVNLYWSPRDNSYDPGMMGNSMAKELDPQLERSFEFNLARDFYFGRWNKAKSEEIRNLIFDEFAAHPPEDARAKPEYAAPHFQRTVFNRARGSLYPNSYWGDRRYAGMVRDLTEARDLLRKQFPEFNRAIAWLNQHIDDIDDIRNNTQTMIHKAVTTGLKKLDLDNPRKYEGPQR